MVKKCGKTQKKSVSSQFSGQSEQELLQAAVANQRLNKVLNQPNVAQEDKKVKERIENADRPDCES